MGFSGIGFSELLLLCVIVVLLFGTKKISTLGSDLGAAIRGFRQAMQEGSQVPETPNNPPVGLSHSSTDHGVSQGSGRTVETSQHTPPV